MPYDRQYVGNLLRWAETEVVGLSPLALRMEELVVILEGMRDDNKLDFAQDLMSELRQGLEEMQRQRRHAMALTVNGSKVCRDPNYIISKRLLTTNPSIPNELREWALSHFSKGETYG